MNPLKLHGGWAESLPADDHEIEAERQRAAVEYIAASDDIRIVWRWLVAKYGPATAGRDPSEQYRMMPMHRRLLTAEARCVALGVWAERRYVRPRRFREGRSSAGHTNGAAPEMRRPVR